jgi:type I restriction enzyme, S subunit
MNNGKWPMVPLGEVLIERSDVPTPESIVDRSCRIVAKIAFDTGQIHFRSDTDTKTGMILIRSGDLVVSGINAYKGAIALYTDEQDACATIHYGAYEIRKDRAYGRFLWWLLRSQPFRDLLEAYVPGGIKTELKAKRFLPVPIPCPTVDIQRVLAARLDDIAKNADEVRRARAIALRETDALMVAAITRRFDAWPMTGKLGDVLLAKPRNGWSARCNANGDGTPVLSLSAVTGFRYRAGEFKRTSEDVTFGAHYWLRAGDLLISRSNTPDLVGHAAIYDGEPSPCIYPDLMMRIDLDDERANSRFVHYLLQSRQVRDYVRRNAKGTSPTMKKISQGIVMGIPYPTGVPLEMQAAVVSELDVVQHQIDDLKEHQSETAPALGALVPAILDRAFRGEL